MIRVKSLHIYPLKSGAANSLVQSEVESIGLKGDRRFMLISEDNRFITQRDFPRMARIRVGLLPSLISFSADGVQDLAISLPLQRKKNETVTIWKDRVEGEVFIGEGRDWFSLYLGVPCRLIYQPDDSFRAVDPFYGGLKDGVSLADGFPVLLTTEASLQVLNNRLDEPVPMNRFRPNVVVTGTQPFEEDEWKLFSIGSVLFEVVKPCARCMVITIDQDTGMATREPLETLAGFRKQNGKVLFGQNAIPRSTGTIQVGDTVQVIATR